jgi:lipopolysaccharide export system permease protein
MIRRRYLSGLFIGRLLAALLGLASLIQLLDLLDRASEVLHRGGMADLARYAGLRLPSVLGQMVPLAVLVAGMLTLRRLAMTLEMTALRAAGIPVRRVLTTLLPACLLAALVQAVLLGVVAPRTERALARWWAQTDSRAMEAEQDDTAPKRRVWLRAGNEIVGIDRVSIDGTQLQGVLLVPRGPDALARARIQADSAVYSDAGWTLKGVRTAQANGSALIRTASQPWPEGPPPANIVDLARPTEAQEPLWLLRALRREQAVDRGPAFYATRLQGSAARLFGAFIMLLLAAPVAFEMPRRGGGALRPLLGLCLGLGYLLLAGLLSALGEAGVIPVTLAVWTAPILFAAIGGMLLMRFEEQ